MAGAKIHKPDWEPIGGQERSLDGGNPKGNVSRDPVEFKEKYPRVVIPEK